MSDIFRQLNDHLSGKELFIRFTARAFLKLLSMYVFSYTYFPFGFEGRQDMGSDCISSRSLLIVLLCIVVYKIKTFLA